jgi:hypothetical protein
MPGIVIEGCRARLVAAGEKQVGLTEGVYEVYKSTRWRRAECL